MEEENKALNETVEEENNVDTTPVSEAQAVEDTETEVTESAEEVTEETVETDESPKKGYSNRVRELNTRAKDAEAEVETLSARLKTLTETPAAQDVSPQSTAEPIVQPGEEIDASEFDKRLQAREQRILQKADSLVQLRGKQQEAVARINREADEVMRKYPELDDKNDDFNKELSSAITEATEAYVMKNPYSASVSNFVDKMMRPYKGAVSKEVGDMAGNMAKQVSESAVRPTSVRKQEKPATEKSIAELEAELGTVQA